MSKARVKISIFGEKVQGVGFRASAQKFAQEHGITGWVTNTEDGNVVICAEGAKNEIKKLIDWCKIGPKSAKVVRSEAYYQKYKDEFTRFEVK